MANATATLKVYPFPQGLDATQRRIHVNGTLAISASPNTYPTGGLPLSWVTMVNSLTGENVILETNQTVPFIAWFQSVSGSGYNYLINLATNKVQIFTTGTATQTPSSELTNGTVIPAGISGDSISFEAEFLKSI